MAYSSNPNLPNARATAMKLLMRDQLPLQTVANKCGVHRSTVYRWKLKWLELNTYVQFANDNRPTRHPGTQFRMNACRWRIVTTSSAPHTSPQALSPNIVELVFAITSFYQSLC